MIQKKGKGMMAQWRSFVASLLRMTLPQKKTTYGANGKVH